MAEAPILAGVRVIVVEDEFLLAVDIAEDLVAAGASVVGPLRRLPTEQASSGSDCAVVDVDTPHGQVWTQVSALLLSGTPTAVVTGDVRSIPDPRFAHVPILPKPVDRHLLAATLAGLVPPCPSGKDG